MNTLNPNYLNKNDNNYYDANKAPQQQKHVAAVVPKYTPLLYTLLFLLLVDFVINSFSELAFYEPIAMLVMFM